mmetsp:Transcript_40139/g.33907  ORF Transcript_40139/g.33907 Transcript_40139/m.33907 type:complete len:147 (-) Transcript_40139:1032-1472(-)
MIQSKSNSKFLSKSKSNSKSKTKTKLDNFDVSVPWGEAVATYIGSTIEELKANLPKDSNLNNIVGSTCSMIRNLAIKELMTKNSKAGLSLKDICYGTGYIMHDGKMIKTGACHHSNTNHGDAESELNVGDGSNNVSQVCNNKEGEI